MTDFGVPQRTVLRVDVGEGREGDYGNAVAWRDCST